MLSWTKKQQKEAKQIKPRRRYKLRTPVMRDFNNGKYDGKLMAARADFISGLEPVRVIAKRYRLAPDLVKHKMELDAREGRPWVRTQKMLMKKTCAAMMKCRADDLNIVFSDFLTCAGIGIREIKRRLETGEMTLSIREIKDVVAAASQIHNIEGLEIGRPTSIIDYNKMGIEDIEAEFDSVIEEIKDMGDLARIAEMEVEDG